MVLFKNNELKARRVHMDKVDLVFSNGNSSLYRKMLRKWMSSKLLRPFWANLFNQTTP
jgi:hypothetical protein